MKNFREYILEKGPCWTGYKQVGTKMKNGKRVPNCVPIESVDVNESAIGDKLMKSQSVRKTLGGNPMKFHQVGKPVVVHGVVDGYHEDYIYYTDGKYVLAQAGHKQVGDARNVNPDDTFQVYMVDSTGTMSTAELKKYAMNDAKEYMDKVLKASDKVRDFSKEDEGQDIAPKQIKRVPFKESVEEGDGPNKGESWEAGYKRRVVKTTKPEHKEKGYNWRIKGKERNEISIKLYKTKPSYQEYTKQMKRVAGHEFGG